MSRALSTHDELERAGGVRRAPGPSAKASVTTRHFFQLQASIVARVTNNTSFKYNIIDASPLRVTSRASRPLAGASISVATRQKRVLRQQRLELQQVHDENDDVPIFIAAPHTP